MRLAGRKLAIKRDTLGKESDELPVAHRKAIAFRQQTGRGRGRRIASSRAQTAGKKSAVTAQK